MAAITQRLLEYSRKIDKEELFPTLEPGASHLIHVSPYAFTLATCLDRGMPSEVVGTIPYYIYRRLGHLDPFKIHAMSLDELKLLLCLRFTTAMPTLAWPNLYHSDFFLFIINKYCFSSPF